MESIPSFPTHRTFSREVSFADIFVHHACEAEVDVAF